MHLISSSIIGEYPEQGFVEALLDMADRPSLRYCVKISDFGKKSEVVRTANLSAPSLIADIKKVEHLVHSIQPSEFQPVVIDVWVNEDGFAEYTCSWLDSPMEEELFVVQRDTHGSLSTK